MAERLIRPRAEIILKPQRAEDRPEDAWLNRKKPEYTGLRIIVLENGLKPEKINEEVSYREVENIVYDKTIYEDFHTLRRLTGVKIKKPFYNLRYMFAIFRAESKQSATLS